MSNKTKRIICLQGKFESGKTSTMIRLSKFLLRTYKNNSTDDVEYLLDISDSDFVRTIENVNGKKVGINSRGDDWKFIKRWIEILYENKCDIIFCTCHSYGRTEEVIQEFGKAKKYEVIFVKKERETIKSKQKTAEETAVKGLIEKAGF